MSKYAVEVKDIKKSFFLPNHKNDSIKSAITQVFKPKEKGGSKFNALDGVSFNVEKGDFFGILGRNGSGKSTLLKIISEIYQPTSGSVEHDGKVVSFIELGVGFKTELSGRENVYLNGALLGFSKEEVEAMYDDIVSFAELEKFMDQKLKNYSSGMKVRLAFSVAIRAKADILILDEVLAVGDAAFQKKCYDYFRTLKNDGKTVILVTHGMGAVRDFCNKAIVIENGKIIFKGNADVAADEYLKLFNKSTDKKDDSIIVSPDYKGTERVDVENVDIQIGKDNIIARLRLTAKEEAVDEVKVGLIVRDSKGSVVAGVNSILAKGGQLLSLEPHQSIDLCFDALNTLGKDTYTISFAVRASSGEILYDYNDATKINNQQSGTFYPTVLPARIDINKVYSDDNDTVTG